MSKQQKPVGTDEESPERTADYHRGASNSMKDVMQSIKDDRSRHNVKLSGVDDKDIREVRDPGDGKSTPEPQRKRDKG